MNKKCIALIFSVHNNRAGGLLEAENYLQCPSHKLASFQSFKKRIAKSTDEEVHLKKQNSRDPGNKNSNRIIQRFRQKMKQ
ncbi:hypothetical protein T09_13023 [Trichinella sp. T9]|nr:hypothetical protein T09_13023 [Trichinella sp. T9]